MAWLLMDDGGSLGKRVLDEIKMRKETIEVKAENVNQSADWTRLSPLRYVCISGHTFGYCVEVSWDGKSTKAIVAGTPCSYEYVNDDGEKVRDFETIDSGRKGLRANITEKLGRGDDRTWFL